METTQTEGLNKKLYPGIIVILLLLNAATLFFLFTEDRAKIDLSSEKTALQTDFKMLTDSLDLRNSEIEQFIGKNADLDKSIAASEQTLNAQKKQIENLFAKTRMTVSELYKVKTLISEYEISITQMSSKVGELTRQNQELLTKNDKLSTDLSLQKTATAKLSEQNKGLVKKAQFGSLLKLANLDVEAIKQKNNGKEVPVKRAKVAENLKISFETGENKVLDPGPVSLYIRIINPKGETIFVTDRGSGTILSSKTPDALHYTRKADIDYKCDNKKVVVYWGQNINDPGTYKVEVYQNGFIVGQGQVKLS